MKVRNKVRTVAVASLLALGVGAGTTPAFAASHAYRVTTASDCSVTIKNAAGDRTTIKPGTARFIVNARQVYVSKVCGLFSYKNSSGKLVFGATDTWLSIPTTYGLTFDTYA